jgi:hypothetical protein
VAKKAAPARKKAVAKKAAPARKKAVAKKAGSPSVRKIEFSPASAVDSEDKAWLQREAELPIFLKDVKSEIKKEPISTQGYAKKKSRKPVFLGFALMIALMGTSVYLVSINSTQSTKPASQEVSEIAPDDPTASDEVKEEETQVPATSPTTSTSASAEEPRTQNSDSFAPRNFVSTSLGQEINFAWTAPAQTSAVIGYELSVKKVGTSNWVVISSVTPEQQIVSVELVSLDSTSQYRIASILENGKIALNKTVLAHAGTVD